MPWSPAQLYYYFEDADGVRWCIYLRWDGQRGDEPWTAELMRCDENWDFCWDSPDNVNLLEEKNHKPGRLQHIARIFLNYFSTFTNVSGRHTFSRDVASAKSGAMSLSRNPAMPQPIRVT